MPGQTGRPEVAEVPRRSEVSTTDIALASYWHMRGLELFKLKPKRTKNGKGSRYAEIFFRDPEGIAEQLAFEYTNSESMKFDESQRAIKKVIQRTRDRDWR